MYNHDIITSQGKVQISTEVRKSLGPSGPFFFASFQQKNHIKPKTRAKAIVFFYD